MSALFSVVVRAGIALALLGAVLLWIDLNALLGLLVATPMSLIVLGATIGMARQLLLSWRWSLLATALTSQQEARSDEARPALQFTTLRALRYRLAASSMGLFLPTALGVDLARAWMVARESAGDRAKHIAVIAFDRIIGLVTLATIGLFAGLVAPNLAFRATYLVMSSTLLLSLLALILTGTTRFEERILEALSSKAPATVRRFRSLRQAWHSCSTQMKGRHWTLFLTVILSLVTHGIWVALVIVSAKAYGVEVPAFTLVLVTAISWMVTILPIGFGGLGLRELSFAVQLAPQGVPPEAATAVSLFQYLILVLIAVAGIPVLMSERAPGAAVEPPTETHEDGEDRS